MNPETFKQWLNSRLNLISHSHFKDCVSITEIDIKPLTDQIIVIVSDIFRVTITQQLKDGTTRQLKAVAKLESTTEGFNQMAKDLGLADAEAIIYEKVLKIMEELIKMDDEAEQEIFWPACYLSNEKLFLLEDLNVSGYSLAPKMKMLDVNHAKLAVKVLAKYHGLSLIMKEQGKLDINKIPPNFFVKGIPFLEKIHSEVILQLAIAVENEWGPEWNGVGENLRKCAENLGDKLKHIIISNQGKCSVLCHGDFTIRNMLFHYSHDDKTPDKVKILDFQGPNWSNLCCDLVTLLCSSMMPQIREENLETLLTTYSKSLERICRKMNYQGEIPTLNDIHQSYKSFGYYTFLSSTFAITAIMAANDFKPGQLLDEDNSDAAAETFKPSYYKLKIVQDAMQFEVKRCLKLNIL